MRKMNNKFVVLLSVYCFVVLFLLDNNELKASAQDECCHWGVGSIGNQMVNGLPVNDMMRGPDPKSTCTDCVDPEAPPPLLVTELHVAGVISYLVNTLEVMYQEGTSL